MVRLAIAAVVAAVKVAAAVLIAKRLVEAGDERWGKNPQQ